MSPPQLNSSNASLDDFLRKVWDQRDTLGQLVAKGIGEVANELYGMYKKSEMPLLRTVSTESYLDGLAAIGHRAGPNAGPYLQDSPQGLDSRFLVNGSTTANSPEQESFLGRTFYRFDSASSDYHFITHKVYVRADPNHAIGLMDHVVSNILGNPEKYPGVAGAKVAGPDVVGERCDNFVIYLTDEATVQRVIDNLNVYRTKHPLAFGPDTPPMSQPVAPGISIAHPDCSGPYKTEAIARVINDHMGRGSRLHRDLFSSHEIPAKLFGPGLLSALWTSLFVRVPFLLFSPRECPPSVIRSIHFRIIAQMRGPSIRDSRRFTTHGK